LNIQLFFSSENSAPLAFGHFRRDYSPRVGTGIANHRRPTPHNADRLADGAILGHQRFLGRFERGRLLEE